MKRLVVALMSCVLLAACASGEPTPTKTPTPDLGQLRAQYGIPECPHTDADAQARPGGLPKTQLSCLGTNQVVNLAGLPKKPMVINLWAQWCGPCREESPYLREVSQSSDVTFLGINYQDPQPDWAIEFAGLAKWPYPHVVDQERTLQEPLRVPGVPTTIFVDGNGIIVGTHPGEFKSSAELEDLIETYLGGT